MQKKKKYHQDCPSITKLTNPKQRLLPINHRTRRLKRMKWQQNSCILEGKRKGQLVVPIARVGKHKLKRRQKIKVKVGFEKR